MSNLLPEKQQEQTSLACHPAGPPGNIEHDGSDYGDFGTEEELTQLEDVLTQLDSQITEVHLAVTDIEDYEPPNGVRLPKVIAVEQTHYSWEVQAALAQPDQVAINLETNDCSYYRVNGTILTDVLTSV